MIDRFYQVAYVCAYQLMRMYWRLARPSTHGALVAIWHKGRILLVRNSYVSYYSLPGGYVRSGETGLQAAARELKEEVSLEVSEERLELVLDRIREWEGKRDRVELFRLDVDEAPRVEVDNREVVAARFFTPEEALRENLFPTLREHIEQVVGGAGPISSASLVSAGAQ